jgi:hypothetical protein
VIAETKMAISLVKEKKKNKSEIAWARVSQSVSQELRR